MLDEQLIAQLKNQKTKKNAFHELVKQYQEKLYWHVRKIVMNHDDTDDILQNIFIKIWNNIDTFREESSIYTWMFRIATNESLTFIAQKKRRNIFLTSDENSILIENLAADKYFEGSEIQMKLQKAILKLPEKQRIVFNMKYYDDIKYQQISEILGTSVGALKASYHHAVKKIQEYMQNDEIL